MKEVPAAVSISMEAPALLGDAAPSSPQPAVMTITVAAHMNIPFVTLRQELAERYVTSHSFLTNAHSSTSSLSFKFMFDII